MTNEEAAKACSEIYNGFWNRWKNRKLVRHSPEWERIHTEAVVLLRKYPFAMAEHMVKDFMDELEERVRREEERK